MSLPKHLYVSSAAVAGRASANVDLEADLRTTVQPVLEGLALKYNTSFAMGFKDSSVTLGLAAGLDDHREATRVTPNSAYPSGSVTKTWTAALIMQLMENGVLALDDPISRHIDPLVQKATGTRLAQIWGNDGLDNVTIKQLLSMSSGVNDYNDYVYTKWTLEHSEQDLTPYMFLQDEKIVNKTMVCDPGKCSLYSSVGYVLLGLVLANHLSTDGTWLGLEQLNVIPEHLREEFKKTFFPLVGQCTDYLRRGIVHQYHTDLYNTNVLDFQDIIYNSCLNGWTMGNIAAPPLDIATFYYKLLTSKEIVSKASVAEMLSFKPLTTGWFPGLPYGLGTMVLSYRTTSGGYEAFYGHGGEDWGSNAMLAGVHSKLGFGITVSTNSNLGMNCSLADVSENFYGAEDPTCVILDSVHSVLIKHGLNVSRLRCTSADQTQVFPLRRPAMLKSGKTTCLSDARSEMNIIV